MSATISEHRTFHMIEAVAGPLNGAPQQVRRRWSDEFKERVAWSSLWLLGPFAAPHAGQRRCGQLVAERHHISAVIEDDAEGETIAAGLCKCAEPSEIAGPNLLKSLSATHMGNVGSRTFNGPSHVSFGRSFGIQG